MIKKATLLLTFILLTLSNLQSQVVEMIPGDATVDSSITIYFDATEGDQGLMDYDGEVYAHTGVITMESTNGSDWKHVVADWGTENDKVLMTREGENLYSLSFHIKSYYNIQPGETVLKLAFVFRNADGSQSARAADGSDIFVSLEHDSQWQYQYFTNDTKGLKLFTSEGVIKFRPYGDEIIKTSFLPVNSVPEESYGIIKEPLSASFDVDTTETEIYAVWNDLEITIVKSPVEIIYLKNDTLTVLKNFLSTNSGQGGTLTFQINEETKFYGGGSRALPFDLSGQKIEFYNQAHYGYGNNTPNLNLSIPVLASSRNFGLIFDNHHRAEADIGKTNSQELSYKTFGGNLSFFLMTSGQLSEYNQQLSDLTGYAPLPPLWALGYIQSRYGYETRSEAEQIVSQMQNNNFPMDALVLDLYWFGGTSHMGDFNWDLSRFPNPSQMMQNFRDKGVETIVITEPYFTLTSDLYDEAASLGHFAENSNGNPYILYGFWAGDASLLDMSSESARQWLWPYYKNLFDMGVSGLWTDLAEPETHPLDMQHEMGNAGEVHNLYNNFWSMMLHDNVEEFYPEKRLFNLTRSGYMGMQRYSTYPWSGDIQRSFSGLQAQIPIMLHNSMSGIGYMHSDLGGFTGGYQNAELYSRWMQLGTFSPVMRAHGTGVPPEPIYYDNETRDIAREAIQMRYEFLPYNYTLSWEYSTRGIPPVRPMNYYNPNASLNTLDDQYFWGKDLLVAPIITEGAKQRMVVLPEGDWADYTTGEIFEGNQTITASANLNHIPLYLREGGFLVQSMEKLNNTKDYDSDSIRIRHFIPSTNDSSSTNWYYDDGISANNIESNKYNLLSLKSSEQEDITEIELSKQTDNLQSPERLIEFMVYGLSEKPGKVELNNHEIPVTVSKFYYNKTQKSAYWDDNFLYVHFNWRDTLVKVTIDEGAVSAIASKQAIKENLELMVKPNPISRNTQIVTFLKEGGMYNISLYNTMGETIGKEYMNLNKGKQSVRLTDIIRTYENLSNGVYILVMENKTFRAQTKLIKTP